MQEFLELLNGIRPDVDFENTKNLVSGGILKSFDIIQIVGMIDDEYDVKVPVAELKPENFDSAQALFEMIERLDD
ncbi:MAG: acyl carrier protein [Ruminococcaceae bacterium]|nr:acyl carrier protein [Oscillospiraceae bacterium]